MNQNGSQNGGQMRYHKHKQSSSTAISISVIVMFVIIVVGVIVYIMSLTGTGLFRDSDGSSEDAAVTTKKSDETTKKSKDETEPSKSEETESKTGVKYRYIDKTMADTVSGDLVLVDKDHKYTAKEPSLEELGGLTSTHFALSLYTLRLKPTVANALVSMTDDMYTATGYDSLMVDGAYRSVEYQQELYNSNPSGAAMPGCSDYHTGTSLSLAGYNNGESVPLWGVTAGTWLKENARNYGFIFRYPAAKKDITGYNIESQMRYVGIPHSTYMANNDLCLEEYLDLLATKYKYSGEHLMVDTANGMRYEIFYVAAVEDGKVKLPVPSNREYTVSGDNKSGFIVTVNLGEAEKKN